MRKEKVGERNEIYSVVHSARSTLHISCLIPVKAKKNEAEMSFIALAVESIERFESLKFH